MDNGLGILSGRTKLSPRIMLAGTFILSALPFLAVELFRGWLYRVMDIASYLVFHNIAEFFSVMVSLSIFGVGWYTYRQSQNSHVLFLSAAFLAIGLMDFMHALGYAGMPSFITPNSANKSTQFWIAVRLFSAASFLVSGHVYPDTKRRWLSRPFLSGSALVVSALVFTGVTFFPSHLPATFIEGAGLTPFKKVSEYVIIGLLALASFSYWRRFLKTGDGPLLYYVAAFIICIFSELVFAVYKSVFDTFNVIGHIYKVAAFFLIYEGTFATAVKAPYSKLSDMSEKLRIENAERRRAEEEVRQVGAYNRSLIEASLDPLVAIGPDGKITDVNFATEKATGRSRAELVGTCFSDYFTEPEKAKAGYERVFTEGFVRDYPLDIRHRDGHLTSVLYNASVYRDGAGRVIGIFATARDITELKRAEEAMKAERQRFNDILEMLPAYLVLLTPDYHVPFANRFFRERFGESHGRRCYEYLFGRSEPCEICETYKVLKTGTPHRWEWTGPDGRNYDIYDFPFTELDGSTLILEMGIDITERKRAEEELEKYRRHLEELVEQRTREVARSEKRYRSFVEVTSQFAWVTDPNGLVVEDIPAFRKFTGQTYEQARDTGWIDALHPEDMRRTLEVWNKAVAGRTPYEAEYRMRQHDGEYRLLLARGVPILGEQGNVLEWVGTCIDITERKQVEEAINRLNAELRQRAVELEAANKELEAFAYSVSHDLRAPLRAIDGFSRIIEEDYARKVDKEGRRILGVVRSETKKMGQLIDDLLFFSRAGRCEMSVSGIDMESLARSVCDELMASNPGRNVELRIGPLPAAVGDQAMVRQVFVNLVSNALKFTRPREKAVIEVSGRRDKGKVYSVKDNGVGFDMQYVHKLFSVFQRLHSTEEFEGTGVGLAIVQRIIIRHGGCVSAEGAVGEGATFYFTLPDRTAEAPDNDKGRSEER